tara:strand:+ start:3709 stop:5001 length:1293 start_codon:yes stop_codon:yes gene_type:complete
MNTYNELGIKVTKTLDDLSMIVTSNLLSRINTMKVSGMAASEVRKVLVADLIAGGRIFGQLRNGVKGISKNAIEEAGNIAAQKAFEQQGLKQYKWISVGKNVCPDCKPRHGTTGDLDYFKAIGMPKSEFSVCGLNCNCMLVPIEYEGEDLSEPIKYKKPSPTDFKMGGKHKTYKEADAWISANLGAVTKGLNRMDMETVNTLTKELMMLKKQGYNFPLKQITAKKFGKRTTARVKIQYNRSTNQVLPDTQELQLNLNHLGQGNDFYKLKHGIKGEMVGWSPAGVNNLRSVLTHELGHAIASKHLYQISTSVNSLQIYTGTGKKLKELHEQYRIRMRELYLKWEKNTSIKQISKTKSYLSYTEELTLPNGKIIFVNQKNKYLKEVYQGEYISDYAKQDIDEWIAECFTMAFNSPNPSPFAVQVQNLLLGID